MSEEIIKINNNTEIKVIRHGNGEVESETPYVDGKKHGLQTRWYDDGTKEREERYKAEKKHGMETWWHENGEKWCERKWMEGKMHGMETGWYEGGQKHWEEMWKEDKRHGVYSRWWENGQKRYEAHYLDHEVYAEIEWDKRGIVTEVEFPTPSITTTHKSHKAKKIISTRG